MQHTTLSHLTDEELLLEVSNRHKVTDLERELALRLELALEGLERVLEGLERAMEGLNDAPSIDGVEALFKLAEVKGVDT